MSPCLYTVCFLIMAFCHQLEYLSYSALDPNMKKVYLFFFIIFFKERLLMYVSKTGGLVYIFKTLNLDIVKEVICCGGE